MDGDPNTITRTVAIVLTMRTILSKKVSGVWGPGVTRGWAQGRRVITPYYGYHKESRYQYNIYTFLLIYLLGILFFVFVFFLYR